MQSECSPQLPESGEDSDDHDDDNDDDQAKPCIKPSKKQLRRHLSSAELTNTVKTERDYDAADHQSHQSQRPQSVDRWAGVQVYSDHYRGDTYHEPDNVWPDGYDYGYEEHLPPPHHDTYHHQRDQYRLRNRDYRDASPSMPGKN